MLACLTTALLFTQTEARAVAELKRDAVDVAVDSGELVDTSHLRGALALSEGVASTRKLLHVGHLHPPVKKKKKKACRRGKKRCKKRSKRCDAH